MAIVMMIARKIRKYVARRNVVFQYQCRRREMTSSSRSLASAP